MTEVTPNVAQSAGQAGVVVRASTWHRLVRNPMGLTALVILGVIVLIAVLAPLVAPGDPNFADIGNVLAGPGGGSWLGTDSAGRDIASRLVYGAQVTLLSAALAAAVAIAIGLPAGLLAGYYGGTFDGLANWTTNILLALPSMVVLLAVRAAIGPSTWIAMVVFGVLLSPGYYRLTRTAVQSVRNELYVDAARVSGLSDGRIIARHIFSVVRAPIIIQTAMVCGVAISIQSALEFLGLGDPMVPTWGVMVADGFRNIYRAPLTLVWPSAAIAVTIAAFVLLGNALRDSLEDLEKVKEKRARPVGPAARRAVPPVAVESGTEHHLLKVTGLGIGYPQPGGGRKTVVDGVSFHVDRNEVLGIVGESGSGKTQTAFAILGLLPDNAIVTGGAIQFDGVYTVAPDDDHVHQDRLAPLRGKRISYIPQEPMSNLDPAFTVGSQLTRPMVRILGITKAAARDRALNLLASVGIPEPQRTYDAYPHEISGGMAQRVLIAGAISCEPDLIIADEPTTALDVTVQAEVLDVLRELQSRLGLGIVVVTHNFGVVADICDRVVVMQNGRLVEEGPVRAILRSPQDPYTKVLLDAVPHLGQRADEEIDTTAALAAGTENPDEEYAERIRVNERIAAAAAEKAEMDKRKVVVDFEKVAIEYPKHGRVPAFRAATDIDLTIHEGEVVGLVGESGSGKTTLGRAVLGLAPVTAGRITFLGKDISHAGRRQRQQLSQHLQVVFQDPYTSLNPAMTVGDILSEPLGIQGITGADARRRVQELLDRVHLPVDAMSRLPREFSGGQRQRIAIARALALRPQLIVCDEPVSALDLTTQARVLDLLLEIQQGTGVSYLFVSHDLDVVRHISHRVAVMHRGRIVEQGEALKVTQTPDHPYTQRLLLASPVPDPDRQAERRSARQAHAASQESAA